MLSYIACSCLLHTRHFRTPHWTSVLGSCRHQCRLSQHISYLAYKMGGIEIMTAIIGGIFGFLGGVSLKVLENE